MEAWFWNSLCLAEVFDEFVNILRSIDCRMFFFKLRKCREVLFIRHFESNNQIYVFLNCLVLLLIQIRDESIGKAQEDVGWVVVWVVFGGKS